jgi:hypothetical protein
MRNLVLFTILVSAVGCSKGDKGDPGDKGDKGNPGIGLPGDPGRSVTMKAIAVGDQACPAGGALLDDGNNNTVTICNGLDGMGVAATKVPHLVVQNGGEDLGPTVSKTSTWYAKAGGEVDWYGDGGMQGGFANVYYDQNNCQGNRFMKGRASSRIIAPWGSIAKANGAPQQVVWQSQEMMVNGQPVCVGNAMVTASLRPLVDLNLPAKVYTDDDVAVELR